MLGNVPYAVCLVHVVPAYWSKVQQIKVVMIPFLAMTFMGCMLGMYAVLTGLRYGLGPWRFFKMLPIFPEGLCGYVVLYLYIHIT